MFTKLNLLDEATKLYETEQLDAGDIMMRLTAIALEHYTTNMLGFMHHLRGVYDNPIEVKMLLDDEIKKLNKLLRMNGIGRQMELFDEDGENLLLR